MATSLLHQHNSPAIIRKSGTRRSHCLPIQVLSHPVQLNCRQQSDSCHCPCNLLMKPEKVATVGHMYCHQLRTSLPALHSCDWPYTVKLSYISDKILHPYHFNIHCHKFTHPVDGDNTFLQNAGTLNHNRASLYQQPP